MLNYIIPFATYVLSGALSDSLGYDGYAVRNILTFIVLIYFWRSYDIRWDISTETILGGIAVACAWLMFCNDTLAGHYVDSLSGLMMKAFGMLVVAPLTEELFIRDFFARSFLKKGEVGDFSLASFIVVTIVFGIGHDQIYAGITSGIILNIIAIRTRNIGSCISAHIIANIIVFLSVLATGNQSLW